MKKRQHKSDSIAAAVQAMTNAAMPPLEVPKHCRLRAGDMPFWSSIIASRVRDQWTECDLVLAAQLSRVQAAIEAESTSAEPSRIELQSLSKRQSALVNLLRLGGVVDGRATREERKALEVERTALRVRRRLVDGDDESLLAS